MGTRALSLAHRVRKPTVPEPGPPPLLLLLHGVGSNEDDLMPLAEYLDGRFFVVSARAPITLRPGAYAWYHVTFTPQGPAGAPQEAEESRQKLLRFVTEAVDAYGLDPQRVYLMGFSQGAIMSLFLALTQPGTVAGVVAMSGRLLPEALERRAPDATLSDLPILAVHGTQDTVLPVLHGREIRDQLRALPVALTYHEYPDMAHEVTAQSLADIGDWLTRQLNRPAGG